LSDGEIHSTPSFVNCKASFRNDSLPLSVTNNHSMPISQAFVTLENMLKLMYGGVTDNVHF
ncbi:hypothetical protein MNL76_09030, partial [Fervidobacterium riparium]